MNESPTLWAYGCSWTYSDLHERFLKIRFWPDLVAGHLKMEFTNRGFGGESTSQAAIRLMNDLSKIKKGDIVIFQFTYPERLSLTYFDNNDKNRFWADRKSVV